MKVIVETTGKFGLLNTDGVHISARRPSVAKYNNFVEAKIAEGLLKLFAKGLPDEASDEDFGQLLKEVEKDVKVAVVSYCSLFGIDPAGDKISVSEANIAPPNNLETTNAPLADSANTKMNAAGIQEDADDNSEDEGE